MHTSKFISASAGTGKTSYIINAIQSLVASGANADKILCLTFTNNAAREIEERISKAINQNITSSTLHAFCYKIINNKYPEYQLIDDTKHTEIIKKSMEILFHKYPHLADKITTHEKQFIKFIHQNIQFTFDDTPEEQLCLLIRNIYDTIKAKHKLITFDEIIQITLAEMENEDQVCAYNIDKQIEHMFIDEAQDLTPAQWQIIEKIVCNFSANKTITIVGDKKQSIYSFQGVQTTYMTQAIKAIESAIIKMNNKFEYHTLYASHRCPKNILNLVNRIFHKIDIGTEWITNQSSDKITDSGKIHIINSEEIIKDTISLIQNITKKYKYNQITILFRTRSKLFYDIENALEDLNIPNTLSGAIDILNTLIIQDIINICKMYVLPDIEIYKINYKNSGIKVNLDIKFKYTSQLIAHIIKNIRTSGKNIRYLECFLIYILEREGRDFDTITSFIHWIHKLEMLKIHKSYEKNAIRIMTCHASKGTESDVIIMPLRDKRIMDLNLKEYYRLLYVSMTRAKKELYILGTEKQNNNKSWFNIINKHAEYISNNTS